LNLTLWSFRGRGAADADLRDFADRAGGFFGSSVAFGANPCRQRRSD
jgi:hypothetical protein